ncbi:MAG: riboflavin synthase [Deltaproteobacteria bacterium]|nr:riboflavin synthase [Deltaproteobacteria bacterium]
MFTGLVEGKGSLLAKTRKGEDILIEIALPFAAASVAIGDSIAVNGACLTVEKKSASSVSAFVSAETKAKTTLGRLPIRTGVNIVRALQLGSRLGGHLVTGHIDTVGTVIGLQQRDGSLVMEMRVEKDFSRYLVAKGSIAIDGVSLTINSCSENTFFVNIIPLTAQTTTLGGKAIESVLNIEFDIIGKYVERFLKFTDSPRTTKLDSDFLTKHGFV